MPERKFQMYNRELDQAKSECCIDGMNDLQSSHNFVFQLTEFCCL